MEILKFKIIKSKTQYKAYCKTLEKLVDGDSKNKEIKEEIELLTFLIEKWDKEHNTFDTLDPVEMLESIMKEHNLKAKNLAEILDVSKSLVSEILNYKKGLSKDIIRTLSNHFMISQEAFNRPYELVSPINSRRSNVRVSRKKTVDSY